MVTSLGRALRHRNFRLHFAGQGTSLIGTWLTRVAMSFYAVAHLGMAPFVSLACGHEGLRYPPGVREHGAREEVRRAAVAAHVDGNRSMMW